MFEGSFKLGRLLHCCRSTSNLLYLVVAIVFMLGTLLTLLNVYQLHHMKTEHELHEIEFAKLQNMRLQGSEQALMRGSAPIVWIQGSSKSKDNDPKVYLKHVYSVFEKLGFTAGEKLSDWIVAWLHDYPFVTFADVLKNLKPYQKVNHFPGSGFITNKLNLAQTKLDFIPKAFELPSKKDEFLEYVKLHKNTSWVLKGNQHRGIRLKNVSELDLTKEGMFVQEYIADPFLIEGHKFDIGIYTIITSIDPLRVYIIDGDVLLRFCPQVYYPFNSSVLDKYVVGDDYLPLWKVPSVGNLYTEHGFSFKNSFSEYLRSVGKNPTALWEKLKSAIRDIALIKEPDLIKSVKKYPSKRNFFELIRFDFVVEKNLGIFLMEGNMSPNLSSDHFINNARLYEHVIFNLLGLVGVSHFTSTSTKTLPHEEQMMVSSRDVQVFPEYCSTNLCAHNCMTLVCKLCKSCLSKDLYADLKTAYLEHTKRGSARRVFPPAISWENAVAWTPESNLPISSKLNVKNKLMFLWFIGKCRLDAGWCI